jgi:hypothetical protein
MAAELLGLCALGVSHVQLLMDPHTPAALEAFAPVLGLLDRRTGGE